MGLRINNRMGLWMGGRAAAQASTQLCSEGVRTACEETNGGEGHGPSGDGNCRTVFIDLAAMPSLREADQALVAQRQTLVRLRELAVAARDPNLVNGRRTALEAHMSKTLAQLDSASPQKGPDGSAGPLSEKLGLCDIGVDTVAQAAKSLGRLDAALMAVERDRAAVRACIGVSAVDSARSVTEDNQAAARSDVNDANAVHEAIGLACRGILAMGREERSRIAGVPRTARTVELLTEG
jgi:hypothetical protein